ncbi:tripartite tricarboxylate transporter substrate binding protein [Cupriavidus necator]|uniref:Bug family tripartite tricarboxylate transporter substrate binding protein n=1 Tax=Cupriavidus necator TaxID=106590 RepID=UPI003ECEE578
MTEHIRTRRRFLHAAAAIAGTAAGLPLAALAAKGNSAFPERPVRFIVPFPAGTGTDTVARLFAKAIGDLAGQSVVVENKPGANGIIAVRAVLSAPADGYTVLLGSNSTLSTNAVVYRNLPYDPLADFSPITLLSSGPCVIVVSAKSPYHTLADLLADARKRPNGLNYGAGSIGYTIFVEWMDELAGVKTTSVPYKGANEVLNGVMTGDVDFAVTDATVAVELVKAGKIRALAYTSTRRMQLLPNVPTVAEAGLPAFQPVNWVAVAVPAKTPVEIAARWHALFARAGTAPEVRDYFARNALPLILSTPAELRQVQKDEMQRWKRLASTANIPLQ